MKKKIIFLLLIIFISPIKVKADYMYNIDMNINILKDGSADITEVWDVEATSGTEWYKTMYELGDSKLSNFVVYMDEIKLNYNSNWNENGSLIEKRGYYGINETSNGIELCFGKSDMKRHKFTIKYTLSNYIFNTDDSQVLYWTLMPKVTANHFSVNVTSYYNFPNNLDVWGYGYKGYVYVENGKISMSEAEGLKNNKVVLLAKFPRGTFNTDYKVKKFKTFDDVLKIANEGSYKYNYSSDNIIKIINVLVVLLPLSIICLTITIIKNEKKKNKKITFGYIGNKKINKKEVPMFREIPCNKDIYYANILIKLNDFNYNKFNIIGAILLKWIKIGKIIFYNKKVYSKKENDLIEKPSLIMINNDQMFDSDIEKYLYNSLFKESKDGELNKEELKIWAKYNCEMVLKLLDDIEIHEFNKLKLEGHIYNRMYKTECKDAIIMDDIIYKDSKELYGLKLFLEEFSQIETKEVMEVKIWDEYLMFAHLFGIAEKVTRQFKDIHPESIALANFNEETMDFLEEIIDDIVNEIKKNVDIQNISNRSSARNSAQRYSSGGGGFSFGGGGSSSFGDNGKNSSMGGR